MLQLRIFFVANVAFTCFFVENVVITRFLTLNFTQNFWKKSSEIRRILAEILRKKFAAGASEGDPFLSNRGPKKDLGQVKGDQIGFFMNALS